MKKQVTETVLTVIALDKLGQRLSAPTDKAFTASPYDALKAKLAAMRRSRGARV